MSMVRSGVAALAAYDDMIFLPALRFLTRPFPPGAFAARFFAATIFPPLLLFFAMEPESHDSVKRFCAIANSGEAPDPARREEGEYRVYSTDEQRRGAGCLGSQNASVIS